MEQREVLTVHALSVLSCSSTKTLTATSGVISSPNWPQDYPNYRDCYWNIEVGNKRSIKIAFMDFHLEYDFLCDDDKLKVKGGRNFRAL